MKAVLCKQFGPPETLVVEDLPSPKAGAGEVVVSDSTGHDVALHVGDAIRVETTGRGGWRLGNCGSEMALLALVQMPPPRSTPAEVTGEIGRAHV